MNKLLNKLISNTVVALGASFSTVTKQVFKILRTMRWAVHGARVRERRNSYRVLVGKPGGKRSIAGSRSRWKDIKMYLIEKCWESANCINPVQYTDGWRAVVNTVMNIRVPEKKTARDFLTSWETTTLSLSTTLFNWIIIIIIIIIIFVVDLNTLHNTHLLGTFTYPRLMEFV